MADSVRFIDFWGATGGLVGAGTTAFDDAITGGFASAFGKTFVAGLETTFAGIFGAAPDRVGTFAAATGIFRATTGLALTAFLTAGGDLTGGRFGVFATDLGF